MSLSTTTADPAATAAGPDLVAINQRQQATWASGDFAVIGTTLQIVGELLAEAVGVDADLNALLMQFDTGRRNALVVPGEYLEVVVTKSGAR